MATYCYITFPSTFFAIRAESLLQKMDFPFKMVPVPRAISSSCGTSLRCSCSDLNTVRQYLAEHNTDMESFFKIEEYPLKMALVKELDIDEL